MELDFSKLENIAYRGFEGEKARAEKDALLARGFTILEGEPTPFAPPPDQDAGGSTRSAGSKLEPIAGAGKSFRYREMYLAACAFHECHSPPIVACEYWRTHTPGADETPQAELDYWEQTAHDMQAEAERHGRDPFFVSLLEAIHAKLAMEYERERNKAATPFRNAQKGI